MQWTLWKRWRPRRTWLLVTAAAMVVVAGTGGWLLLRSGDDAAASTTTTAQVATTTIQQSVSASGTVEPAKTADLDFAVSGTVTHVYVAAGAKVIKGQRLAEVSATSLKAARTAAQSTLDAAQAQLAEDQDADASDVQLAADETAVVSAQASLDEADQAVEDAVLRATIAGTVTSVGLEAGDTVGSVSSSSGSAGGSSGSGGASSATGLSGASGTSGSSGASGSSGTSTSTSTSAFTIVSAGSYVVDATVASADVAEVKKGLQAQVTVTGVSSTVYGTVQSIGLVAQTNSSGAAVFPVTIKVTGTRTDLYPGTSATASVIVRQLPDVLVVPSRALKSSGDTTYVLKMVDGTATKTTVKVGQTYGAQTEVVSGLSSGDTVQVPGFTPPTGTGGSGTQQRGSFGGGGFPQGGFGGGAATAGGGATR